MRRLSRLLAIFLLVGGGCSVDRFRLAKAPNTLPADPRLSSLERAELLRAQSDYIAATIEYRKVIESAEDPMEREEARIGAAKSLIKLHRLPAAMAVLGPLPVQPMSEWDSRKLAIAGEIYLREHRHKEAETCLELALDACRGRFCETGQSPGWCRSTMDRDPPRGNPARHATAHPSTTWPWRWGGSIGSRGGISRVRGDNSIAVLDGGWLREFGLCLSEDAAVVFRMQGSHIAAERAQRVADDLNAVLRQYAPYKPPPVTQGFPPGRK